MKLHQIEVWKANELIANIPIHGGGADPYRVHSSCDTTSVPREVQLEIAKHMRRGWTSGMVKDFRWKLKD